MGKSLIILVLYVDDCILIGIDPNLINHVKSSIKSKFEMTDLGNLHYFLCLQVLQSKDGISLSQSRYSCDLIHHFHMEYCNQPLLPFSLESNSQLLVLPLKFMLLYIVNFLENICICPIPILTFPLSLALLLGFCTNHMKVIGKKLK